jgi:RecB family exonuclease
LPLASEAREEEHLLLAHMLGAAGTYLTVSWQRADESGVARVPSLALREIGRLTIGAADLDLIAERAERIPTHPLEFGRSAVERWGLLPAKEARINAALQLADPRRLRQALPSLPAGVSADHALIEAGLTMLGIVEDFSARDLRFDACVGDAVPPPAIWSPSRLERLGVCPQQYFFRHALHIDELLEPSTGYEVPLVDLGRHIHHVLQIIYRSLLDEGALSIGGADSVRRAEAILEQVWERESTGIATLVGARYPLLWEAMTQQWLDALRAFLRADIADLVAAGGEVVGLEQEVSARLTLGPQGTTIDMHGRFDRIRRAASGELVISDYKTSGNLHDQVGLADVLKGRRLQMPLYLLMAEALQAGESDPEPVARAEILGVGPAFTRDASTWDEEAGRAALDPEKFALHRDAFGETLAVLVDLAAAGFFPLNDQHARICEYCPFVRACRRGQAPTAARIEAARAGHDYFLLQKKSTKAPLLQTLRNGAGRGFAS